MPIVLRPVALKELQAASFARDMGNKKLRIYTVSLAAMLVRQFATNAMTPFDLVAQHIKFVEKDDSEVVLEEQIPQGGVSFDVNGEFFAYIPEPLFGGKVEAMDISAIVLGGDKAVGRALMKNKVNSQLFQRDEYKSFFQKLAQKSVDLYNSLVLPINKLLYKIQGGDFSVYNPFLKQLSYINKNYRHKMIYPAHFLSISFEEKDLQKAVDALLNDLRLLYKEGLIIGNFCMPKMIRLEDTLGAGRKYYVIFCAVFINDTKLFDMLGINSLDEAARTALKTIGVKYETPEGQVSWLDGKQPGFDYDFDMVYVSDISSEEVRKQVIDSYELSKEYVNSVAKKAKESIQKFEKLDAKVEHFNGSKPSTMKVYVNLLNKETGEILDAFKNREKNAIGSNGSKGQGGFDERW